MTAPRKLQVVPAGGYGMEVDLKHVAAADVAAPVTGREHLPDPSAILGDQLAGRFKRAVTVAVAVIVALKELVDALQAAGIL